MITFSLSNSDRADVPEHPICIISNSRGLLNVKSGCQFSLANTKNTKLVLSVYKCTFRKDSGQLQNRCPKHKSLKNTVKTVFYDLQDHDNDPIHFISIFYSVLFSCALKHSYFPRNSLFKAGLKEQSVNQSSEESFIQIKN